MLWIKIFTSNWVSRSFKQLREHIARLKKEKRKNIVRDTTAELYYDLLEIYLDAFNKISASKKERVGKKYLILKSTSYELRVESLRAWVKIQMYEFKSTSYKFESSSYELKSTSFQFESTSYEFKSIISRITWSMKIHENSLKNS